MSQVIVRVTDHHRSGSKILPVSIPATFNIAQSLWITLKIQ